MKTMYLIISLAALFGGVFSIATSSIGVKCNNDAAPGTMTTPSYYFLIVNIVSAAIVILGSFIGIYMSIVDVSK